nr:AzlD domain-containing protein [Ktedonobacteraceae bacterium]
MSQGLLWLSIIIIGLLTLGIRLSFMLFMGKMRIVPMVQQALRFVPVAVLSALIAPALFLPGDVLNLSLGNIRLIAGIVAILVAWRTKNVLLTILIGMACLLILQAFVPQR